jgi:hypothetical protein|tara:strand:- start:1399 stop:1683 length:285 start_codon:yes stop_codon:yes gene_type:complete
VLKRSILILACITLTACEEGTQTIGTIKDYGATASGAVHDAKDQFNEAVSAGKSMTDGVMEMIQDAKNRINQVQSGVNMLMEGKELIESGVSGE